MWPEAFSFFLLFPFDSFIIRCAAGAKDGHLQASDTKYRRSPTSTHSPAQPTTILSLLRHRPLRRKQSVWPSPGGWLSSPSRALMARYGVRSTKSAIGSRWPSGWRGSIPGRLCTSAVLSVRSATLRPLVIEGEQACDDQPGQLRKIDVKRGESTQGGGRRMGKETMPRDDRLRVECPERTITFLHAASANGAPSGGGTCTE